MDAGDIQAAADELGWSVYKGTASGSGGPVPRIAPPATAGPPVTQIEVRAEGETISVQSFAPGRIIVGRSPDNEIYIKSKFVSRHHAQLVSDEAGCTIEDLNSTNGVFVDERQVKKYRLRDGDVVSLGVHQLVYRDLRERPAAALNEGDDDSGEYDDYDDDASQVGSSGG